jgi:hypothetical protein
MGLENYLLSGNAGGFPASFSDQPSGGSSKLVGLVRGNQDDSEEIGDAPAPATFAVGSGPTPYDTTGYQELALNTQAFGPIPSGLGVSERGDIIQVNTSALEGPIEGGLY